MGIKFLNLDKILPGSVLNNKVRSVRPTGYKFPLGLNSTIFGTSNVAASLTIKSASASIVSSNIRITFTSSGFVENAGNIPFKGDALIVAGGGGGGRSVGGGGGAGGLIFISNQEFIQIGNNAIVVGAAGAGSGPTASAPGIQAAGNGSNSYIGTVGSPVPATYNAIGGGGGGNDNFGYPGGSGGGTMFGNDPFQAPGTPGQGNSGGKGISPGDFRTRRAGGGGGAGGVGGNAGPVGGPGGVGLSYSISGSSVGYAGGGGGGGYDGAGSPNPAGGPFGGGNAALSAPGAGGGGSTNRGGGGGGASDNLASPPGGSNGGSGIVILLLPLNQELIEYNF